MQIPLGLEPTEPQLARVQRLTALLGCSDDDVEMTAAPDLPPAWITVIVGSDKGRPKVFDLDPEGKPL